MSRTAIATVVVACILLIVCAGIALALSSGTAAPGAPSDRQLVAAPIESAAVRALESNPIRYVLDVRAGLPSGCAQQGRHEVTRTAETMTVAVLNSMPSGNVMCTMIYGTYNLSIDLGSDFKAGAGYTVRVNDKATGFTAR